MRHLLLFLMLSAGFCFGDTYEGPTDLSMKFYDDLTIHGPAKLHLIKAKTLNVEGSLDFQSLAVAGQARINGNTKGEKGKFGQLFVTGTTDVNKVMCENLTIQGAVNASYMEVKNKANIEGTLNAKHCRLNTLVVKSDKVHLEDVDVITIIFEDSGVPQTLILKGGTKVTGDITFESGKGSIEVDGPKVQMSGKVAGGTLTGNHHE